MKTIKTIILLALILLASIALLLADTKPLIGGISFVVVIFIGYLLNKIGWIITPNDF